MIRARSAAPACTPPITTAEHLDAGLRAVRLVHDLGNRGREELTDDRKDDPS